MHEALVNRSGGLSLPWKSVVRLIDRPAMTLDVYRGRKTTMQQQQKYNNIKNNYPINFIFTGPGFFSTKPGFAPANLSSHYATLIE